MRTFATSLLIAGLVVLVSAFNILSYKTGSLFDIALFNERNAYLIIGTFVTILGGVLLSANRSEDTDQRPYLQRYWGYWHAIDPGERMMVAATLLVYLSFLMPWQLMDNTDLPARLHVFQVSVLFIAVLWSYPLAAMLLRQSFKPARYLLLSIISLLFLLEHIANFSSHFIQFNGEGMHQTFSLSSGALLFLYANFLYFNGIVLDMYREGKII